MADTLAELKVKIGADLSGLEDAAKRIQKPLDDMGKRIQGIGLKMAAAGAVVVAAVGVMIKKTADAGDAFRDLSQRTGISVEILSAFKLAADKSGTSIDGFATGMKGLSRVMYEAATGGKEAKDTFAAVGVSATDGVGKLRPLDQVMLDVANRFAGMADGGRKNALAMKLFGKSGMDLIPVLNLGRAGLEAEMEMAKKLGLVFTTEAAVAADRFNDAMTDLNGAFTGIRNDIAKAFIPVVTQLAENLTSAMVTIRGEIAEFVASGKFQEWVVSVARAFVTGFQVMAKAVEGLLLTVQFVQGAVFKIGEMLMKMFADWGVRLFAMVDIMAKVVPGLKGIRKEIADAVSSLVTVGMEYRDLADQKFEAATDIVAGFEALNKILDKVKTALRDTGTEAAKTGGKISDVLVPAANQADLALAQLGRTMALDVMPKVAGLEALIKDFTPALQGVDWQALPEGAKPALDQVLVATKSMRETISENFEGMFLDLKAGFVDLFTRSVDEGWGFARFMGEIFKTIRTSLIRTIGEMLADWMFGFIDKIKASATSAGKTIADSIGGATGGVGKAAGSVASSFLSAAGSIANIVTAVASVISLLKSPPTGAGDGMGRVVERQDQQTAILGSILEFQRNDERWGWQTSIKVLENIAYTQFKTANAYLKSMSESLKNVTKAAGGYSGIVTSPTLFVAGERGAERVEVTPLSQRNVRSSPAAQAVGGGRQISLTFNVNAIDRAGVETFLRRDAKPILERMFSHNELRVPVGAVGG